MEGFRKAPVFSEAAFAGEFNPEVILTDTKERIKTLLQALKEKVEHGDYGTILGIDSSGRVPALLLAKTIAHKDPNIETRFVAGNRNILSEEKGAVRLALSKHFSSPHFRKGDKKVLIVDDALASGSSLELICDTLQQQSIPFDIATLCSSPQSWEKGNPDIDYLQTKWGTTIITAGNTIPEIYGKAQMSGVKKSDASILSIPLEKPLTRQKRSTIPSFGKKLPPKQNREVLSYTRNRINDMAKEMARDLGWTS